MRALVLVIAFTGCVAVPSSRDAPVVPIRLDAGGIEPLGTGLRVDFGRAQAGVIDTISRLQNATPRMVACDTPGVAAAAWDDGLTLVFRNGTFRGWATEDATRTADGTLSAGAAC